MPHPHPDPESCTSHRFARTLSPVSLAAIHHGNAVTPLHNGNEIFPAMLDAVARAERSITFENFVWWKGETADRFTEAFCERARAGVPVHVVLDWAGSLKGGRDTFRRLADAGVDLQRFHRPGYALHRINRRTHRKILVVDGRLGFTGGVGIADEWKGDGVHGGARRDIQYRLDGPVVADLQAIFFDRWNGPIPAPPELSRYFPPLAEAGDLPCQIITNSPHEGFGRIRFTFRLALSTAQRSVLIGNAYFAPDRDTLDTLVQTARRGVDVQLIVPGPHMDHATAGAAQHATYGRLLDAGIRIHEYQPSMYHAKVMAIDDELAICGSANLDERSLRLSDESNLLIYDERFTTEQRLTLEHDRRLCQEITPNAWRRRPRRHKLAEKLGALLRPQV